MRSLELYLELFGQTKRRIPEASQRCDSLTTCPNLQSEFSGLGMPPLNPTSKIYNPEVRGPYTTFKAFNLKATTPHTNSKKRCRHPIGSAITKASMSVCWSTTNSAKPWGIEVRSGLTKSLSGIQHSRQHSADPDVRIPFVLQSKPPNPNLWDSRYGAGLSQASL